MSDISQHVTGLRYDATRDSGESLPRDAALLVVDLHKAAGDPCGGPGPRAEARRLLAAWRAAGRTVVHVRHLSGEPGADREDEARPRACECVIQAADDDAFAETGLAPFLGDRGIDTLVIAGVATDTSVAATLRAAGDLGYRTYLVADAVATGARRGPDGRLRPAEELQALTLAGERGTYATVTDTAAVLAAL